MKKGLRGPFRKMAEEVCGELGFIELHHNP